MARVFKRSRNRHGKTEQSQVWYVEFMDHAEIRRRVVGFTDKAASEVMGAKIERLVAFRAAGELPDVPLSKWLDGCHAKLLAKLAEWGILSKERMVAGKLLSSHVEEWKCDLLANATGIGRAETLFARVSKTFTACGFRTWSEIDAVLIAQQLSNWRDGGHISTQTSNHYVQSLRQFCKWMVDNGRATASPLRLLGKITVTSKRRELVRRALTDCEFARFTKAALTNSMPCKGLDGFIRATIYVTVRRTGLRWSELRSLCRSAFELAGRTPKVYILDDDEKHPRGIPLPLKKDAVEMLKEYFARYPGEPEDKAFPMPSRNVGADLVRHDLELAGIPYSNREGLVFDFHAIRGQLATDMARAGIPPQKTQKAMRHSDINLTMRYYTHLTTEDQRSALEQLPPMNVYAKQSDDDDDPETSFTKGGKKGPKKGPFQVGANEKNKEL